MKRKHERQPPAPMKAEAALTAADKEELQMLQIGEGGFNKVIRDCVAFMQSPEWTTKKTDEHHHIVWDERPSKNSNKKAIRFTAKVPNCNAATLEHLLVDDKDFRDDPEESNIYKYDNLITENHVDKRVAGNVTVQRNNFRSPVILVSPRQMVSYTALGCLLDPAQQEALGLRPSSLGTTGSSSAAARSDNLMAFMQCSINYTGSESELVKGHVLGRLYHYCVLGVEEADGSLTLTFAMDMDPAGKLPAKVVDATNDEQLKKVKLMMEWLTKKGPTEHICNVYENTRDFKCRKDS